MCLILNKNLDNKTIIEIGKFAILWNIFESQKMGNNCIEDKLKELSSKVITSANWKKFACELKKRSEIVSLDTNEYVDSGLSLGKGIMKRNKQIVKDFINSNGEGNLDGGLIAIYRIRNNMFHGLKDWTQLDEQIELFASINKIIEEILN